MPKSYYPSQSGFTLIEIILALMIISIALGAIITTTGTSISHASSLKEQTIALWVAENTFEQLSIDKTWPTLGKKNHTVNMAGKEWHVINLVTSTPNNNMRKMTINVYSDKKLQEQVVSLVAYAHNPSTFKSIKKQ